MATILELEADGSLIRLKPNLRARELELRTFMVTPDVREWMEKVLPALPAGSAKELSPQEKLVDFLRRYGTGARMTFPVTFRPIQHIRHGVWELKPPELRLFGWFPQKDLFICTNVATIADIKVNGKPNKEAVRERQRQVVFARSRLPLVEPKYLPGGKPEDVLSACDLRS